jgi:hypothetical protein
LKLSSEQIAKLMFIFAANQVSAEILISISDLFWELSVE